MRRLLMAALLAMVLLITAFMSFTCQCKVDFAAPKEEKPHGAYVLTPRLRQLTQQREQELQLEAFKAKAAAAHAEVERLKKLLAEKEAALAVAQEKAAAQLQQQKQHSKKEAAATTGAAAAETFEATHYTAGCNGCSGITATGLNVSHTIYSPQGFRIVAVDPRVIPLGSIVEVTYKNGSSFKAVAADTGGAIKGKKIDILVASKKEAYNLGRVAVQVRVLR